MPIMFQFTIWQGIWLPNILYGAIAARNPYISFLQGKQSQFPLVVMAQNMLPSNSVYSRLDLTAAPLFIEIRTKQTNESW